MQADRQKSVFVSIDLKSFYASVECQERNLNPLTTHLVVADAERTEETICLAVSPALKSYGIPGRARLFEVIQKVKEINYQRLRQAPNRRFSGKSHDAEALAKDPGLELDFIIARPRMQYYLDYSAKIYQTYLKFVAPEDIFAYSIDEVFCEITHYLKYSHLTAAEYVTKMITAVFERTGITATAGIGTNMFLCKVAMDILAKHAKPNAAGVRIAELDEMSFRRNLWGHRPITDFWRVGRGYAKRLAQYGLYTMGDVALCSLENEDLLYKIFGVNAELLIDHSWGYEPTTIQTVKNYRPKAKSLNNGQVLQCPYDFTKSRLIVKEMAEQLALELSEKGFVTDQLVLHINYDIENLKNPQINYTGPVKTDHYGRLAPYPAHGTLRLDERTNLANRLRTGFVQLFDTIADPQLLIRKFNLSVGNLVGINENQQTCQQLSLFTRDQAYQEQKQQEKEQLEAETRLQQAILEIRARYGKNAIMKGMSLEEGSTAQDRNHQIGGHRA